MKSQDVANGQTQEKSGHIEEWSSEKMYVHDYMNIYTISIWEFVILVYLFGCV